MANEEAADGTIGLVSRRPPAYDGRPAQPEDADQIWLRRHALSPWEFDVVVNPDRDGRWVFRRDPTLDPALDDLAWPSLPSRGSGTP